MLEIHAKVSSKNQITLPAEVRRRLGIGPADKVAFVFGDGDVVELRTPRYDLESVLGSIPALPGESLDLEQEIAAATEEVMSEKARRKGW
jgi:AbrB family looped-hinge helix DNA binding protein